MTAVLGSAPTLATALELVERRRWFSVPCVETGRTTGVSFQQATAGAAQRRALTSNSWDIDADVVDGQYVLLLDDAFVTGASVFTDAHAFALRRRTAHPATCLARHIADRHWNYWNALRITRRHGA